MIVEISSPQGKMPPLEMEPRPFFHYTVEWCLMQYDAGTMDAAETLRVIEAAKDEVLKVTINSMIEQGVFRPRCSECIKSATFWDKDYETFFCGEPCRGIAWLRANSEKAAGETP